MSSSGGPGPDEPTPRRDLYDAYVRYHRRLCTARPCDDPALVARAARLLEGDAERSGPSEPIASRRSGREPLGSGFGSGSGFGGFIPEDARTPGVLRALAKATELLEVFCINLFLQPWKKEIRTIKTFTGPFVYRLLPALSSSAIRSVLGSIGYVPHTETETNGCVTEYKLSEEANPEGAAALGLELFLARLECNRLLKTLEPVEPGSQAWQEVLGAVAGPCHHPHNEALLCPATKTTEGQEQKEEKPGEEEEEEGRGRGRGGGGGGGGGQKLSKSCFPNDLCQTKAEQVTTSSEAQPKLKLRLRPRRRTAPSSRCLSEDSSIAEMQRNYPDLTIRGHPLLQDKAHKASAGRSKADYAVVQTNRSKVLPKSVAAAGSSDGCKAGITAGNDNTAALNTKSEASSNKTSGHETVAEDAPPSSDLSGHPRVADTHGETQTPPGNPPEAKEAGEGSPSLDVDNRT